jgi:hypothetical protein
VGEGRGSVTMALRSTAVRAGAVEDSFGAHVAA